MSSLNVEDYQEPYPSEFLEMQKRLKEVQTKYIGRDWSKLVKHQFEIEVVGKMAEIGWDVAIEWEPMTTGDGAVVHVPQLNILGRLQKLS